jgi:DMSO/TMAO reductase YedYZ molybdopterin-dependent catalytic subunit
MAGYVHEQITEGSRNFTWERAHHRSLTWMTGGKTLEVNMRRPGILGGVFVAAMLTAALIGTSFFAWRVAGLPFVPFDVFDLVTRVLPGGLVAFGVGTMVTVIRALDLGPTAASAKTAEQAMAITGVFIAELVGGVILFFILRARRRGNGLTVGLALGAVLGIPAMLISLHASNTASVGPMASAIWILGAFLVWGVVLGAAEERLIRIDMEKATDAVADRAVQRIDRRRFLITMGGATAVITVGGAAVGELAGSRRRESLMALGSGESMRWSATHPLPNANAAVQPAPGTRPEFTPLELHYRIDINTIPPHIEESHWQLQIAGLVAQPLRFTLQDLQRYEPSHQFVTLSCISNPVGGDLIGTTRWTGVSLQRLLPDLRLKPNVTHLKIRSADGFFEVVSLDAIKADPRLMLTYSWDGVPLTREHGYPLRIYIPDVHGMKQPKWIESIEATDHWEPGFWVQRGWDIVAQMHATSVIDTVAVDMTIIRPDRRKLVPIGGIAHAGSRGISKVEVQVDGGPWQQAQMRTPLSQLTWVIWRYDWLFQSGNHTFTVRCYDGNGRPQTMTPSPAEPNGATGLHSRSIML